LNGGAAPNPNARRKFKKGIRNPKLDPEDIDNAIRYARYVEEVQTAYNTGSAPPPLPPNT
jgi:hypothetical protein